VAASLLSALAPPKHLRQEIKAEFEDAELLAPAEQEGLADGPVRDGCYEAGRVLDVAVLVDEEELESPRLLLSIFLFALAGEGVAEVPRGAGRAGDDDTGSPGSSARSTR
jgi:hypothetical protein